MSRLDRYVFREVLTPSLVAFGAYTGFMLVRGLFQFSDLVLQSENPLRDTGLVLAFSVPHIVVLTIPIAFLLGLLIGVGRLGADSELVAFRASGLDLVRLYRPIGAIAVSTFGITLFLMVAVVPRTNQYLYDMKIRLATFAITQRIQPGLFSPELAGRRIYVEGASIDRRTLTGLIVSDRSDPSQGERLTLARRGALVVDEEEGRLWIRLEDAVTHHVPASDPEHYDVSSVQEQRILLVDANPREQRSRRSIAKQLREQTLLELLSRARAAQRPADSRMAWLEIHKKFALPAAAFVFGLLGLPLGIVNRRGGRAAGFAVSVAIVLVYYVLLAGGEARVLDGAMGPALAMWFPNLLFLALGLLALVRVRKDRPLFALPDFRHAAQEPAGAPRAARLASAPRAERPGLRSPGFLVDRYVAGRFFRLFLLVLASIVVLYVLIDYMEISDDIAKNHPGAVLVLGYYEALIGPILLDVVPFAFLVAALVTTASLVRSSETTALLSHGVSLFRAVSSLLALALLTGGVLFLFAERVVPRSAAESQRLRDVILRHEPSVPAGQMNAWFRGEAGRFFAAETFDPKARTATGFTMLEVDPKTFRLVRRVDGPKASLVPGRGLIVEDGWTRSFGEHDEALYLKRGGRSFVEAPEASKVFFAGRTDPRQMTLRELARYVEARRRAGADTASLATGLHQKVANAFSALLLTLVGLPFAFRFGRRGAAAGIGVAILLGLSYLFVSQMFGKLGESGSLAPFLAAWSANVCFGLGAAYGLLGVRT